MPTPQGCFASVRRSPGRSERKEKQRAYRQKLGRCGWKWLAEEMMSVRNSGDHVLGQGIGADDEKQLDRDIMPCEARLRRYQRSLADRNARHRRGSLEMRCRETPRKGADARQAQNLIALDALPSGRAADQEVSGPCDLIGPADREHRIARRFALSDRALDVRGRCCVCGAISRKRPTSSSAAPHGCRR